MLERRDTRSLRASRITKINQRHYIKILAKLCEQARTLCPQKQFLTDRNIVVLDQPPYSPDLAPCFVFLFPKIWAVLKGSHFTLVEKVKAKTTKLPNNLAESDPHRCFEQWQQGTQLCSITLRVIVNYFPQWANKSNYSVPWIFLHVRAQKVWSPVSLFLHIVFILLHSPQVDSDTSVFVPWIVRDFENYLNPRISTQLWAQEFCIPAGSCDSIFSELKRQFVSPREILFRSTRYPLWFIRLEGQRRVRGSPLSIIASERVDACKRILPICK